MKRNMPRLDLLIDLSVLLCGLLMPIGEGANRFVPRISQAYVVAGLLLAALLVLRLLLWTQKPGDGTSEQPGLLRHISLGCYLIILFFLLICMFSVLESLRYKNLGLGAISKVPLFFAIGGALGVSVRMRPRRLHWFLWSFAVSFSVSFLLMGGAIEANGVIRRIGTFSDPNAMARDAAFVVLACVYLIRVSRFRLLAIPPAMLGLYALYASGSRGPLFGLLVGLLYILLKRYWRQHWRKLLLTAGLGLIMLVTLYVAYENSGPALMLQRFVVGSSEASSYSQNLRLRIWQDYLNNIQRFLWQGMDTRLYGEISTHMTHNTPLYVLFRYGVFPLISYLALAIYILLRPPTATKGAVELKAIYLAYCVSDLVIDSLAMRSTWAVLVIGLLAVDAWRRSDQHAAGKKHLLIVRRNAGTYGGIEHQIVRIAPGLEKQGLRVSLLTDDAQSAFYHAAQDADIRTLVTPLRLRLCTAWRLAQACAKERVDIVQSHMWQESVLLRLVHWFYPDVRHVFRVHTYIDCSAIPAWKKKVYHLIAWLTDDAVDSYVSINEFNLKELRNVSHVDPGKLVAVHNAVPAMGIADDLQARPWPPDRIAMVAHFVQGKGHDVLVEGLTLAKEKGLKITAELIGGNDVNRGTQTQTLALAEQLSVKDQLCFTGTVNDVPEALGSIPVVVLPSDSEGTPNSLLEAMSLKKLIIATDVGGVAEFIHDGVNGILHAPRSPQAFADALVKACGMSAAAMRAMCEEGYRTWATFRPEKTVEGLSAVYRRLSRPGELG